MTPRGAPSHRSLIERTVRSLHGHPTADDVFMEARKVEPAISLATVYRNLRALVAEGQIRERPFLGVGRFEINRRPHAHLVCRNCGAIADFDPDLTALLKPIRRRVLGWQAEEVDLEVSGLCPRCRPDKPGAGRRRSSPEPAR